MANIIEIVELLKEISDDSTTSKNLKLKIDGIVGILSAEEDLSIKLNKASQEIDELASNPNMDSFTRTQLLGVVGALETVES